MPLKGTGEARGKLPRCRAWLRNHKVSPNEAGFDLREIFPPVSRPCPMGQQPRPPGRPRLVTERYQSKGRQRPPESPFGGLGFRKERLGSQGNRHLRDAVESATVNMGDPPDDANESGSKELE